MITLAIFSYFVIFATILAVVLRDSNIRQRTKYILATLFFSATLLTHNSITSQQGYAVYSEDVPAGQIVAIEISQQSGIFLWLYEENMSKSLLDYVLFRDIVKQPKAYRIEYNEERAKKFQQMKKKMQQGYAVKKQGPKDRRPSESETMMIIDNNRYIFMDPRNLMKKEPQE